MVDPSKEDKRSTFLAQSIFCFGPFLAGYLIRNVPEKYLFTKTTFIEVQAIFSEIIYKTFNETFTCKCCDFLLQE